MAAMDVDDLPDAGTGVFMDVDEKPDLPALEAGERRAAEAEPRYTREGKKILKEYPIFFTTELADHLTLLQYPHRWRTSPVNSVALPLVPKTQEHRPVQARIKSKLSTLEVSVPIEGASMPSYSRQKGDEMGAGVDSTDLSGPPAPKNKKIPPMAPGPLHHITLRAEGMADQTNYCAGVLSNEGLHLTPLLSTMQLRASLTYLDRGKNREREVKRDEAAEATAVEDSEDDDNDDEFQAKKKKLIHQEEKKPEAKTLTVKTATDSAQGANDKGVGRATAALFAPLKADSQEPWTDLLYYGRTTDEAHIVAQSLHCKNVEGKLDIATKTSENLLP